jgi:hypothetical protein
VTLQEMVNKYGPSSKLVRAVCAQRGWRWTRNGAPAAWYEAWREGLGLEIEAAMKITSLVQSI